MVRRTDAGRHAADQVTPEQIEASSKDSGAPVAGGEVFSSAQLAEIDRAIRGAETASRFEFSVYVGHADGESHPFARRLHASLASPDRSVLILVDPAARLSR